MTHGETFGPCGAQFVFPRHLQARTFTHLESPTAAGFGLDAPPSSRLPDSAVNKCSMRGRRRQQVAAVAARVAQGHNHVFWHLPQPPLQPPPLLIGASHGLTDHSAHPGTREWRLISSHSCRTATHRAERSRMFTANDQSAPPAPRAPFPTPSYLKSHLWLLVSHNLMNRCAPLISSLDD